MMTQKSINQVIFIEDKFTATTLSMARRGEKLPTGSICEAPGPQCGGLKTQKNGRIATRDLENGAVSMDRSLSL